MAVTAEKGSSSGPVATGTWLNEWTPEDEQFWSGGGSSLAWRTLLITTANLVMAFVTWFLVSAVVVKLAGAGFTLTDGELYWLAAMPGLAGGTLRIVHTFLTPKFGTRHVVTISSASLLIPLIGWYWAVQHPSTSYGVLLLLAFLAGLGGGNFSSFMPSTSLFFPKRLQGTALGIQAGVGNFGVSLVQFVTPWIIGIAMVGGTQTAKDGTTMHLQNAFALWIPFVIVLTVFAWFGLRSVPVRANVTQQMDIFNDKHTWLMTSLYIMTFGSFAGFSATFPIMIKNVYGGFEGAPVPLEYAFYGPLIGSVARVIGGPISDKIGGALPTTISAIGLFGSVIAAAQFLTPSSVDEFNSFFWCMMGVFLFAGLGNASTFKQIPMIFDPRQAGGVIGWTAAIAAYGPFIFGTMIAAVTSSNGSPQPFFYGMAAFYAVNLAINWWFYNRPGAEKPC